MLNRNSSSLCRAAEWEDRVKTPTDQPHISIIHYIFSREHCCDMKHILHILWFLFLMIWWRRVTSGSRAWRGAALGCVCVYCDGFNVRGQQNHSSPACEQKDEPKLSRAPLYTVNRSANMELHQVNQNNYITSTLKGYSGVNLIHGLTLC